MKNKRHQNGSLFGENFPSGDRIRQARELSGLTQSELAHKLGVSQGLIAQFEGSFKLASAEIVQRIAAHTKRFHSVFFYQEPPVEFAAGSVMFRAAARTTRKEETEARRYAEVLCEMASVLLRHIKPLQFRLEGSATNPAEAARGVRRVLEIPLTEPIGHLVREIEKSGILVLSLPMDLPKRDALSLWWEELNLPVIALAGARPGDRVRMSAAHELGHIVLGHAKVLKPNEEQEAFEFANELLLPESAMHKEMVGPVTLSILMGLKIRWRVSLQALIRRGGDLGILDESRARYLYTQISVKQWRKNEPIPIPLERPRLLRQLFERVYGEDYTALAGELGYRSEFVRDVLSGYEGKQQNERNHPTTVVLMRRR